MTHLHEPGGCAAGTDLHESKQIVNLWYVPEARPLVGVIVEVLHLLFAACFLAGVVLMRDIVRSMDGEKGPRS